MSLNDFLLFLRQIASIAIVASLISLRHVPAGQEPKGKIFLRIPSILLATVLFAALVILGWQLLPIQPSTDVLVISSVIGAILLILGLAIYLWGLASLRGMFAPSSGFAARIQPDQLLATTGPYALVRHPMYLGVILASIGILLLYWTWSGLILSITMFGLIIRARREERLLAEEFGSQWQSYASRTSMWIHFYRIGNRDSAQLVAVVLQE